MIVSVDVAGLDRLANLLGAAGNQAPHALRRAVNHTGDKARTVMVRTLTLQTGLKRGVIVRAMKVNRANFGSLVYAIRSKGGNVSLKFFGARETRSGVSAAPKGQRRIYAASFLKGGRFPKRVPLQMGGHVFIRTGGAPRLPIQKVKSGVYIPNEMVEGATRSAFLSVVSASLPARVEHELMRVLGP